MVLGRSRSSKAERGRGRKDHGGGGNGVGWFSRNRGVSGQRQEIEDRQDETYNEQLYDMQLMVDPELREDLNWKGQHQNNPAMNFFGLHFDERKSGHKNVSSQQQKIFYSLPQDLPSQVLVNGDEQSFTPSQMSESFAPNDNYGLKGHIQSALSKQAELYRRIDQISASNDSSNSSGEASYDYGNRVNEISQGVAASQSAGYSSNDEGFDSANSYTDSSADNSYKYMNQRNERTRAMNNSRSNTSDDASLRKRQAYIANELGKKGLMGTTGSAKTQTTCSTRSSSIFDAAPQDLGERVAFSRALDVPPPENETRGALSSALPSNLLSSLGGGLAGIFGTGGNNAFAEESAPAVTREEETTNQGKKQRSTRQKVVPESIQAAQLEPQEQPEQQQDRSSLSLDQSLISQYMQDESISQELSAQGSPNPFSRSLDKQKRRPSLKLLFCKPGGSLRAKQEAMHGGMRQMGQQQSVFNDEEMSRTVVSSAGQVEKLTDEESILLENFRRSKSQLSEQQSPSNSEVALAAKLLASPRGFEEDDDEEEIDILPNAPSLVDEFTSRTAASGKAAIAAAAAFLSSKDSAGKNYDQEEPRGSDNNERSSRSCSPIKAKKGMSSSASRQSSRSSSPRKESLESPSPKKENTTASPSRRSSIAPRIKQEKYADEERMMYSTPSEDHFRERDEIVKSKKTRSNKSMCLDPIIVNDEDDYSSLKTEKLSRSGTRTTSSPHEINRSDSRVSRSGKNSSGTRNFSFDGRHTNRDPSFHLRELTSQDDDTDTDDDAHDEERYVPAVKVRSGLPDSLPRQHSWKKERYYSTSQKNDNRRSDKSRYDHGRSRYDHGDSKYDRSHSRRNRARSPDPKSFRSSPRLARLGKHVESEEDLRVMAYRSKLSRAASSVGPKYKTFFWEKHMEESFSDTDDSYERGVGRSFSGDYSAHSSVGAFSAR